MFHPSCDRKNKVKRKKNPRSHAYLCSGNGGDGSHGRSSVIGSGVRFRRRVPSSSTSSGATASSSSSAAPRAGRRVLLVDLLQRLAPFVAHADDVLQALTSRLNADARGLGHFAVEEGAQLRVRRNRVVGRTRRTKVIHVLHCHFRSLHGLMRGGG